VRTIRRLLGEPLAQFLLLGLLLFAGYHQLRDDGAVRAQPGRIEVTADDLRQIVLAWMAQGRAAPSSDEMKSLVEAKVREEILYREALTLGLDKDDAIVRRRLAQKMEFLFEDVAALRDPTAGELERWFADHSKRFTLPARVTFRVLYFSPDRRGARARDDAEQVRRIAGGKSVDWTEGAALADPFMFQDYYGDRTRDDVAKAFGPGFAEALFSVTPGAWTGPIESGYGWHLVWVDSIMPARVPPFDEVEKDVRGAWIEEQRAQVREKALEAMKSHYDITLPADLSVPDLAAGASPPLAVSAVVPQ